MRLFRNHLIAPSRVSSYRATTTFVFAVRPPCARRTKYMPGSSACASASRTVCDRDRVRRVRPDPDAPRDVEQRELAARFAIEREAHVDAVARIRDLPRAQREVGTQQIAEVVVDPEHVVMDRLCRRRVRLDVLDFATPTSA